MPAKIRSIQSAVRDERTGKVYLGVIHAIAYQVASKALKTPVAKLVPDFDEGFVVNGKYLTRYAVAAKYDIDDSGDF